MNGFVPHITLNLKQYCIFFNTEEMSEWVTTIPTTLWSKWTGWKLQERITVYLKI